MKSIKVLDCTLRDGGYVNDWMFGTEEAKDMIRRISSAGIDYVELGFIDNFEQIREGQICFSDMARTRSFATESACKTSVMVNIGYGYPVSKFPDRDKGTVDMVRVVLWDRLIEYGMDYCRTLKDKGYEVSIQATHTPQYAEGRFVEFVSKYNEIKPDAFYIVDTFGEMTKSDLFQYGQWVDDVLDEGIRIGYHAHNNMQQAFSNAVAFCEHEWKHDVMIDASVFGMGRGAGNLCLELILKYFNEERGVLYDMTPLFDVFDRYLKRYFSNEPWGYSLPYMLSAKYGINPNYVKVVKEKGLDIKDVNALFSEIAKRKQGETYDETMIERLMEEMNL